MKGLSTFPKLPNLEVTLNPGKNMNPHLHLLFTSWIGRKKMDWVKIKYLWLVTLPCRVTPQDQGEHGNTMLSCIAAFAPLYFIGQQQITPHTDL